MTDSVPIPLDVLAETQAALDAALVVAQDSPETYGKVLRAKANLGDCLSNKSINAAGNCSTIAADKKQAGYHLLRRLDEVKREVKREFGLEG